MGQSSALGSTPSHGNPGIADPKGSFALHHNDDLGFVSPTLSAVMVDAAFYLKRARRIFCTQTPFAAAKRLHELALDHLNDAGGRRTARLYRVFVYDAPPAAWRGHTPISKTILDLSTTPTAQWRRAFHETLKGLRKVALRLGEVSANHAEWQLTPRALNDLRSGRRTWNQMADRDFRLDLRQKGVDMRLGIDIAALAFKRLANQIVLVSGDADFAPAARLARREGIDIILDPLWATIRPDLHEHVDGLRSVWPRPASAGAAPSVRPPAP